MTITEYPSAMSNVETSYLYEEIAQQMCRSMENGQIPLGSKLPSLRTVCRSYGCSLSVALQAYQVLEAQGKIYSIEKSGYFPSPESASPLPQPQNVSFSYGSVEPRPVSIIGRIVEASNDRTIHPLGAGMPHESLLPLAALKRELTHTLKENPQVLAEYTDELGVKELRQVISQIMAIRGVNSSAEDILITNGCSEALALAIQSCSAPGDVIVLENPVFLGIIQILNELKRRIITVPTSAETGMDLDRLQDILKNEEVKAVVMSALYQNPLGFMMPLENRKRAVALADEYDVTLIEDDIYHDCSFQQRQQKPLKSFDETGRVIYCSSFSKTLAPGLRVGWIMAGKKQQRCRSLKVSQTLGGSALVQHSLARYLMTAHYHRHISELQRKMYRQALEMTQLVGRHFPEGTAISQPRGGFYLWVELPGETDSLKLFEAALEQGISIVPGPAFSPLEQFRHCLRISYASPIGRDTEEALKSLAELIG